MALPVSARRRSLGISPDSALIFLSTIFSENRFPPSGQARGHALPDHAARQDRGTFSTTTPGKSTSFCDNRRRAMGVKRLDRLHPPRLAFLALHLGPHDRLPVGCQDQARAGIGDLDPIAAGLVDVKKKCLLDGMLVRAGLDIHAVLEKDVGSAQDLLAAVERVGEVVEAARRIGMIA